MVALDPRHEREEGEDLRLDLQGHVEGLHDVVDAERHAGPGPPHHHGGLQAGGVVASVVDNDLGDELRSCVSRVVGSYFLALRAGGGLLGWTNRPADGVVSCGRRVCLF